MEQEPQKKVVNALLIIAIILIALSIASTRVKPQANNTANTQPVKQAAAATPTVSIQITDTPSATTTATTTIATSTQPIMSSSTSVSLIGKKWNWVATTIGMKNVETPKKQDTFSVTFNANGTLAATTDCNKAMGGYKNSTGTISFSPLASTKMFCEGSQETEFLSILQGTKKYSIDKNNTLIITDGTSTATFK